MQGVPLRHAQLVQLPHDIQPPLVELLLDLAEHLLDELLHDVLDVLEVVADLVDQALGLVRNLLCGIFYLVLGAVNDVPGAFAERIDGVFGCSFDLVDEVALAQAADEELRSGCAGEGDLVPVEGGKVAHIHLYASSQPLL